MTSSIISKIWDARHDVSNQGQLDYNSFNSLLKLQTEKKSALLALCEVNQEVTDRFS